MKEFRGALAPIVWRVPRSRWTAARTLATVGVVISVGAAIPLYSTSLPAMILSAFFFGCSFRRSLPPYSHADLYDSAHSNGIFLDGT
jgi:hypothetical protein